MLGLRPYRTFYVSLLLALLVSGLVASLVWLPPNYAPAHLLPGLWPKALPWWLFVALLLVLLLASLGVTHVQSIARQKRLTGAQTARAIAAERLLAALPQAFVVITADDDVAHPGKLAQLLGQGRYERIADIAQKFAPAEARALRDAIDNLRLSGTGFVRQLVSSSGRQMRFTGEPLSGDEHMLLLIVDDVTEAFEAASRTRSQLQELEIRVAEMRTCLDALPLPLWLRGRDLRLVWCNRAYAQAVEQSPHQAVEQQIELVRLTGKGSAIRMADKAHNFTVAHSEQQHVVIGGQRRLLRVTELPLSAEGLLVGFALDLTQEEELKQDLARHVQIHEQLLDQLGTAIAVYGADQKLAFFNQAYARLWALDEGFLRQRPHFLEVLEDLRTRRRVPEQSDFPSFKRQQQQLFMQLLEPREDMHYLPDGMALRVITMPHPLGGLMFMAEDVTDRLTLQTEYNTLIAVQQETLDNLAEGVVVFGGDGRVRLSNPAFAHLWRLEAYGDLREVHINELFERMRGLFTAPPELWPQAKADLIGQILERMEQQQRLERKDGTILAFASTPLPDGAVLVSFVDQTDSARIEQALRASNAALAEADRLKSEFVANVSYQLRTPLNTIMGFAEILANQFFGTLNERQLDYSKTILEASRRLLTLINAVLDLATIEAGRMVLEQKPVKIKNLCQNAAAMVGEWARNQQVNVVLEVADDVPDLLADEKRLQQILFNLLSNAIQFTPPLGQITLSAQPELGWLRLSVKDTGMGIVPQDMQRVFGKFERAHKPTRQSGAGLGLALVKSFVELHGGRVELLSEMNVGTEICCWLPYNRPVIVATK